MSSQRGNSQKTRAQKHKNKTAFKNNLHDTSNKTKLINSLSASGCCARCKDIIDWKIKYKKYKPLTVPKKCTKCGQKAIKRAYYIVCQACSKKEGICAKCGEKGEIVEPVGLSPEEEAALQSQLQQELKLLPERQRRTFCRLQGSGKFGQESGESAGATCQDGSDPDSDLGSNDGGDISGNDDHDGSDDIDSEFDEAEGLPPSLQPDETENIAANLVDEAASSGQVQRQGELLGVQEKTEQCA